MPPRFHVTLPLVDGAEIELPDGAARHVQVLRLQPGDALTLFDGRGGEWQARITGVRGKAVEATVGAHLAVERESPLQVTLLQALARGEKMDWVLQTLPRWLADGHRVLVFSQFAEMLALLSAALDERGLAHLQLTGATPAGERAAIVGAFQALQCPVLLLSLKAGGVGLNLTAADTVLHLDPWWNPAVQAQASARAHRIGQDRPVFVHQLVVQGSIEERMLELQQKKRALAAGVLGDGQSASLLAEQDLAALLAPLDDEEE